jgi:hypothetical protein
MKMPKRTKEFKLTGDYEGFEFTADLLVPVSVFSYIQTGNWDLIQAALRFILVSWNFVDEEGKPLPQPQEMVPALDVFGNPVKTAVTDDEGNPIVDDKGNPVLTEVKVPAVTLIPMELAMMIVREVSQSIGTMPAP